MQMVLRRQRRLRRPNKATKTKSVASDETHVRAILLFLRFAILQIWRVRKLGLEGLCFH